MQEVICLPKWGKDAVSHKDPQTIDQRQLQTDVLEIVVGPSQQVPGHQLLRGEPLGHLRSEQIIRENHPISVEDCGKQMSLVRTYLVLYDALDSSPSEVETVAERKVPADRGFGSAASEFPQLLLHGVVFPQDETW